jgi:serine/threonine-protein kinase RsbW
MSGGESVGATGGPVDLPGSLALGTWGAALERQSQFDLPGDETAPFSARRAAEDCLAGALDGAKLASIDLLVTELVSNAVRHGRPRPDGTLGLHIGLDADCVRIEVSDGGPGFTPGQPSPYGEGGYGLFLVDELAVRWGVSTSSGTCVWFELARGMTA